jgi:hypothetical protein
MTTTTISTANNQSVLLPLNRLDLPINIIVDLLEFDLVVVDSNVVTVGIDHIRLVICLVVLYSLINP